MGPKERRSSVLSAIEEAAIVALRVQARLPLDDVFVALKDVIPRLTRSSLHRCLQRHGISRLPKTDREKPKRFKAYEIGYFHIVIAELRYEGGKAHLFVAVDRTSKLVFARIYRKATKLVAAGFLTALLRAVPYKIHTVLTDNGVQFIQHDRRTAGGLVAHVFGRACAENNVEHRLTKSYHPLDQWAGRATGANHQRRHSPCLPLRFDQGPETPRPRSPSNSGRYTSGHRSRHSNTSAPKNPNCSSAHQPMTCWD